MRTLPKALVAGAAGLALLVPAGIATAASPHRSHPSHAGPCRPHRLLTAPQRQALRQTGHVELVRHTRRGGDVIVLVQRGAITALTPTAVTLRSKDGFTRTYRLTADTAVRDKGRREPRSALAPGERVMVVAVAGNARSISCLRPARAPTPTAVAG